MKRINPFSFEISLSVLNHLGRNLYRSFVTVLGEAISNSWDANANNVWIYLDKKRNSFFIKDDGDGMTALDFQNKFLKIGYSKRKEGNTSPRKNRPFIGRKGIGKLALLSCANRIHVVTRTKNEEYVGGVIDNSKLDKAITNDLSPGQYVLASLDTRTFGKLLRGHKQGTIIYFQDIKEGIRNSIDFLKKTVALYFRFSLIDQDFKIWFNDKLIDFRALDELARKTEYLWEINDHRDPYVDNLRKHFKKSESNEQKKIRAKAGIKGFIASVEKPRDLKIMTTDEKVGIDLFVNGRLRERDILKHIPTARVVESYLYGQIHFDGLDDDVDRFTSSRESIVADDPKFKKLLEVLRDGVIGKVLEDWDQWRRKHRKDGDVDNPRVSKKERKAEELYNAVSGEYSLPKKSKSRKKVEEWVEGLGSDARFNFTSYAECFVSENLVRKYIRTKKFPLSTEAKKESSKWKKREKESKGKGNISIQIRRTSSALGYLSMDDLAALVDKKDPNKEACLLRDANEYKPIRDALAHTALLTDEAKKKLTSVYENIKGRVRELLKSSK